MTYNTMPIQTKALRISKITRKPQLPKPEMLKRAASLPPRLEKAPPTKKLFWFRPTIVEDEKENSRPSSPYSRPNSPYEQSSAPRTMPTMPIFFEDKRTLEDPSEELLGLGFLD
jgi:hypothetical protein